MGFHLCGEASIHERRGSPYASVLLGVVHAWRIGQGCIPTEEYLLDSKRDCFIVCSDVGRRPRLYGIQLDKGPLMTANSSALGNEEDLWDSIEKLIPNESRGKMASLQCDLGAAHLAKHQMIASMIKSKQSIRHVTTQLEQAEKALRNCGIKMDGEEIIHRVEAIAPLLDTVPFDRDTKKLCKAPWVISHLVGMRDRLATLNSQGGDFNCCFLVVNAAEGTDPPKPTAPTVYLCHFNNSDYCIASTGFGSDPTFCDVEEQGARELQNRLKSKLSYEEALDLANKTYAQWILPGGAN
eukprot:Protomagalhaensia_wolfi_Nauph_80__2200@NODE_2422_length_1096_cov_111_473037_g1897_i0_p1_GENE_NODE_2422_length_1096_cov_111_473037_g1897_i0NODE_2422_length_1096_cov_111_473037_g1897_i0_p1_ORF_typecomplete_len306_score30_28_NODE_2422_length_1096_cov_111_473037_g1897_i032919